MAEKIYHLGVKALIQDKSSKILILKVNQEKFTNPKPGEYWDIPGGRVIEGHTIEQTLDKEIEEEIGVVEFKYMTPFDTVVSAMEIPLKDGSGTKVGLVLTTYLCSPKAPITIRLSEEHRDYAWVSPQEAAKLLAYKYADSFIEKLNALAPR